MGRGIEGDDIDLIFRPSEYWKSLKALDNVRGVLYFRG